MGNTEDQDEDSDEGSTQTLQHQDTVAEPDDAGGSQGEASDWGKLISVQSVGFRGSGPRAITGDLWIGRGKMCDLIIAKGKRMSIRHALIQGKGGGAVFITDHSTNGTSVNGDRLGKGVMTLLSSGDEIDFSGMAAYIFSAAKKPAAGGGGGAAAEAAPGAAAAASKMDDTMAETMTCGICQEILYKCVSVVPCLHNFCSACCSDCLKRSSECPICRTQISEVRRNHDLSNLIDAFLDAHPERKRSAEELAEMDARSTISTESLRVSKKRAAPDGGAADRDDYSDDYSDDYGGGGSDGSPDGLAGLMAARARRLAAQPAFMRCPNCPVVAGQPIASGVFTCPPRPGGAAAGAAATPGGPRAAIAIAMAGMLGLPPGAMPVLGGSPPGQADPTHINCAACRCSLPKRSDVPVPTRCQFCARTLCDAYKRSSLCVPRGSPTLGRTIACAAGPYGRLRPLGEHDIVYPIGAAALRHNVHETKILQDYLAAKGVTAVDLRQTLLERLGSGEYTLSVMPAEADDMAGAMANYPWHGGAAAAAAATAGAATAAPALSARAIGRGSGQAVADAHSCGDCFKKILTELLYQYRAAIPNVDLPSDVTGRSDCWYGKECRTQSNPANPAHAVRLNHICEPRPAGGRGGGGRGRGGGGGGRGRARVGPPPAAQMNAEPASD